MPHIAALFDLDINASTFTASFSFSFTLTFRFGFVEQLVILIKEPFIVLKLAFSTSRALTKSLVLDMADDLALALGVGVIDVVPDLASLASRHLSLS